MASQSKRLSIFLFVLMLTSLVMVQTSFASVSEQAQLAIPKLVVNTSFLNVRSGDGPQYTVVATVVGGTELPALGVNGSGTWFLVSTPVGNGWVDVSFTLPRGDFRFVPVINVQPPAAPTGATPLSIGLVNPPARSVSAVSVASTTSSERGKLQVISVNLRAQPDDAGGIITTLYVDNNAEYVVVGRAFDSRFVLWTAIVVANFGTGWVEADKLAYRTVQGAAPSVGISQPGTGSGLPVPRLGGSVIVVNTSFLNIRSGAGGQFAAITSVPGGTTFVPLGITPDLAWYLVSGDYGFGWVSSEFVLFRGDFRTVPILRDLY
ncbi:MAG: hypothetical protein SGJ24_02645 [Chloroflexota bacterium]|nr:hypothetical protein [Chloroflexota bacterium]